MYDNLSFLWEIGLPFLVALTILVFVHEFGHYIVARWCGVRVEVFSIGFGKELKGWTDKNGTRWKIAAIPLGGYVKMFGEVELLDETSENENTGRSMTPQEKEVSFMYKSLPQRTAIVLAGPLINFIFAIFAFSFLFYIIGKPSPVSDSPLAIVGNVSTGTAAADNNLQRGDQIVQINDTKISFFSDLQKIVRISPNTPLTFKIVRGQLYLTKIITPGSRKFTNAEGQSEMRGFLGITADPGEITYTRQNPLNAIWLGIERTYFLTTRILSFIGEIFVGDQSTAELGGILRIAQISGQVAELGVASYISFLAVLSINLGLINLFPIPLLDGGHLMFYIFEAFRGKPLGAKAQEIGLRFGLLVVAALFIFVTWNDLVHLRFFEFITELLG
ncbi:RIP metalloprotease RseP [Rhodospirillales bacterium]|nr:RIP metalloprotease RseP [Rhodospirillales bacterium]